MKTIVVTRYCPVCKHTTKHEIGIGRDGIATDYAKCLCRTHDKKKVKK